MALEDSILDRIEELLKPDSGKSGAAGAGELQMAAVSICASLYGAGSPHVRSIESTRKELWAAKSSEQYKYELWLDQLRGILRSLASDIKGGRIRSLELVARGEVFGDFVNAARSALADGFKDVAAVLASGALEDALKRFAAANDLAVNDKDMTEVVNALKSAGLVRGPQGTLLQGLVKIRNKAFHAQWDSIEAADVQAMIGFTQEFLLSRFQSIEA